MFGYGFPALGNYRTTHFTRSVVPRRQERLISYEVSPSEWDRTGLVE